MNERLVLRFDTKGVDWELAAKIFELAPLGTRHPETLAKTFDNSDLVCFAWIDGNLVGLGRALSDNTVQSVIYDLCLLPEYQGKGVGKIMVQSIIRRLNTPNVVLWSVPGKEGFYEKLGFNPMLTAMARFKDPELSASKGYIKL